MNIESDQVAHADANRVALEFEQHSRAMCDGFIRNLEIARAAGERDALAKEHIKIEVVKAMRGLFRGAYRRTLGVWPDGDWELDHNAI